MSAAALVGLILVLTAPLSAPRADTDCSSLDIELQASAEFAKVDCKQEPFQHGDVFGTAETISAHNARSLYEIRHEIAGVRTYIIATDPRAIIEKAFAKSESWSTGPGGNGFSVMRFMGWLKGHPDLPLSCFGFVRFSGHVDRSTGYRHGLYGFYCATQPTGISDAETRRLLDALKLHFE